MNCYQLTLVAGEGCNYLIAVTGLLLGLPAILPLPLEGHEMGRSRQSLSFVMWDSNF